MPLPDKYPLNLPLMDQDFMTSNLSTVLALLDLLFPLLREIDDAMFRLPPGAKRCSK